MRAKEPGLTTSCEERERVQKGVESWGQRDIKGAKQANSGDITGEREEMTGGRRGGVRAPRSIPARRNREKMRKKKKNQFCLTQCKI